ncbi:toll-like receptor 13 isoform X1 [Colias croceus]|uniref:toll-like receptor 13 isoform X1 n=2 Tax=Colias crocea TaxID=72248 RepID=UPI001E27E5C9|nr:toll-like receptor 13 isoform X1 [Colias croceus]
MCLFMCRYGMIWQIILTYILHIQITDGRTSEFRGIRERERQQCLTGYMTDVQSWVTSDGRLNVALKEGVVDLSSRSDATPALKNLLRLQSRNNGVIKYLSMARCGFRQVPSVVYLRDSSMDLAASVEYITFYGNNFGQFLITAERYDSILNTTNAKEVYLGPESVQRKSTWSVGLLSASFPKLKELDLRACQIEVLDAFIFQGMPSLTSLYLGENYISLVDAHAFVGLTSLRHLDLSRNREDDLKRIMFFESSDTLRRLNLTSLDLSFSAVGARILGNFGSKLERLSLCYTGLFSLQRNTFANTSLKYLDLSGNPEVLLENGVLNGLEKSLRVLYVKSSQVKSLDFIKDFTELEVLKASQNEITTISQNVMRTMKSLQILDLRSNRVSSWFTNIISTMPKLKVLILVDNNMNIVTDRMIADVANVKYVAISKNLMICYCYVRDMYEIAFRNEFRLKDKFITSNFMEDDALMFHTGFSDYNNIIRIRRNVSESCFKLHNSTDVFNCFAGGFSTNLTGNFLYLDYVERDYHCYSMSQGKNISYGEAVPCQDHDRRDLRPELKLKRSRNSLYFSFMPLVLLPILVFIYIFRRNFRYFLITMRNSAMLSLINEKNVVDETKIFNYDVFVSYCNEDRAWVLDQLLPHVEKDCRISVCLHERDFQVGLSILENIVSCMDRSRFIMLIISRRFLLSQWCQFEMHLAQHRLLETRREDLLLVLLEEIPRSLRPNTLHYLMLTKTYIVWPADGHTDFWRRLKRSLITQKMKTTENDSLA